MLCNRVGEWKKIGGEDWEQVRGKLLCFHKNPKNMIRKVRAHGGRAHLVRDPGPRAPRRFRAAKCSWCGGEISRGVRPESHGRGLRRVRGKRKKSEKKFGVGRDGSGNRSLLCGKRGAESLQMDPLGSDRRLHDHHNRGPGGAKRAKNTPAENIRLVRGEAMCAEGGEQPAEQRLGRCGR